MLHRRLYRSVCQEFNQEVITTVPTYLTKFRITRLGEDLVIHTPNDLPEPNHIEFVEEPYIKAQIITKPEYIGTIIKLCMDKRVF